MDPSTAEYEAPDQRTTVALIAAIFIAGLCSIVYELLIGTVSSYFKGDSVVQFSLTIGIYMAALGVGAWLSRFIPDNIYLFFLKLETLLGAIGGLSVPILYLVYAMQPGAFQWTAFVLTFAIGTLIGFEIPILTRLLERFYQLKVNISNVLSIDYAGALLATILFPFFLLPGLGPFRSSLVIGMINLGIGFIVLFKFRHKFVQPIWTFWLGLNLCIAVTFVGLFAYANTLTGIWSQALYDDRVVYEEQTAYQRLVITSRRDDFRLFLNGNLQFSSLDEYRYHESLALPALSAHPAAQRILVLGGGDGLLVREILNHAPEAQVILVDLDQAVTRLANEFERLVELNARSLQDPKVEVIHDDAFRWLDEANTPFDIIYSDLPDPNNIALARFYSVEFYRLVRNRLAQGGIFVTQATSPFHATESFWTIEASMQASGFGTVLPYHADVPSFGRWGFVIATDATRDFQTLELPDHTRYLNHEVWTQAKIFPPDELPKNPQTASTLDRPKILNRYLKSVRKWR